MVLSVELLLLSGVRPVDYSRSTLILVGDRKAKLVVETLLRPLSNSYGSKTITIFDDCLRGC